MILNLFLIFAGLCAGVAVADLLYIKNGYWQDLENYLNERDEKVIKQLTQKKPQDHHERNTA